ncbi:MAG: DUF4351 domain-containing protein [Acidobacteria bacterium]|nr:DUF4351 domain-containing protein [Acidobacteriota bacterium]
MNKPAAKTSKPKAERQDYDSPWKEVLEQFFEQCFEFFFPEAHAAIDWSRGVEFLDKEMQQIVADAELGRRLADKLAKVWLRDGTELRVIVHLEVQGERQREFEERIYVYSFRSFDRYRCPVASFAILTDEHPNWRPSEFSYRALGTELRLKFGSLKLLDFAADWNKLAANPNPFAVVVMAHLKALETKRAPQLRYRWKLEIIKGLYDRGYSPLYVRQLMRFIDWVLRLPMELEPHFKADLAKIEEEHRMQYVTSWERLGREDGLKEGLQKGATAITLRQLQRKVGVLSARVEKRIRTLPLETVERLSEALLDFKTSRDLNVWLKEHAK